MDPKRNSGYTFPGYIKPLPYYHNGEPDWEETEEEARRRAAWMNQRRLMVEKINARKNLREVHDYIAYEKWMKELAASSARDGGEFGEDGMAEHTATTPRVGGEKGVNGMAEHVASTSRDGGEKGVNGMAEHVASTSREGGEEHFTGTA